MRHAFLAALIVIAPVASGADALFEKEAWPLIEGRCVKCHGAEKQKGDLRLDSREAALKGGESGAALVPGKPGESLLIKLIRHEEKERTMPPKEKLKDSEIASLEKWIAAGAPWKSPAPVVAGMKAGERIGDAWSDARNPIVRIFKGERIDLWSFRAPREIVPPAKTENPIDAFAKAPLAPPADARSLARRLYLDLTGLPPTPEEIDAFEQSAISDQQSAISQLSDKLLASPRHGEHVARQWLDVVRYSDSNGFDWDEFRPLAWRFRDYVIRSFNADKPFDRFIREQLAGDELVPAAPRDAAEQDALIATGFLRLGPWDNSAGAFGETPRVRHALMNDLVETTGAAFLGLSMACARCHDHKTDPISHADFYRLRAFFEPVKFRDDLALDLAPEQAWIAKELEIYDGKVDAVRKTKDGFYKAAELRLAAGRADKLTKGELEILSTPEEKRDEKVEKKIVAIFKKLAIPEKEVRKAFTDEERKNYEEVDAKLQALKKEKPAGFTLGLLATDSGDAPKATRVLDAGDFEQPREEVPPGFLSALDPNPAKLRSVERAKATGRRSALAEWITSPGNPLTARVIVNRVWQSHFGTGLVATPNDFGLAGARPSNPELLDFLARWFVREGWSLKKLRKLIVTSQTWQQSAAPRRLSAEQLRDAMLAVSGRLLPHAGGPPVWPELPEDILKANPAFLDDNETKTKGWYPSPTDQQPVRGVFLVQKRTVPVPFMAAFDLPDNAVSCSRRATSTVAPQALTLLNNPFAAECARAFAARVGNEGGADTQITRAFSLALQRAPSAEERAASARFVKDRSLAELCRALMNLNEFIYLD